MKPWIRILALVFLIGLSAACGNVRQRTTDDDIIDRPTATEDAHDHDEIGGDHTDEQDHDDESDPAHDHEHAADEGPMRMITSAAPVIHDGLQIVHGWSRPIDAGKSGAAYLTIQNSGESTYILAAVTATHAATTELRSAGGIVDAVKITAGATAMLEPGEVYAVLSQVNQMLPVGRVYTLTLVLTKDAGGAAPITLDVPIEVVPDAVADTVATDVP